MTFLFVTTKVAFSLAKNFFSINHISHFTTGLKKRANKAERREKHEKNRIEKIKSIKNRKHIKNSYAKIRVHNRKLVFFLQVLCPYIEFALST